MTPISSRFDRFISQIRPSQAQLVEADHRVAFLRQELTKRIAADGQFHLEKIFRAGSAAKHTNLAPTGEGTFDIDLGAYYRSEGYIPEHLNTLLSYTRARLREIYPDNKSERDFHLGKNAVNVTFHTSKLNVDVVPIIRDGSLKCKNSGWIPRQDSPRLTSITAHIHFIHTRTARSKRIPGPVKFNHLVRLMKWWNRRLPPSLKQCSYFCELITAASLEGRQVTGDWQSSLANIFKFLSTHAFTQPIIFHEYDHREIAIPSNDCVVVLDAVNKENNLTHKWNESTRQGYLECLRQTYDHIKRAQDYERNRHEDAALEHWCQVFGNDFMRLS